MNLPSTSLLVLGLLTLGITGCPADARLEAGLWQYGSATVKSDTCKIPGLVDAAFAEHFVVADQDGGDYLLVPVDGSRAASCSLSRTGELDCDRVGRLGDGGPQGSLTLTHELSARTTSPDLASSMEVTDRISIDCFSGACTQPSGGFPCEVVAQVTAERVPQ